MIVEKLHYVGGRVPNNNTTTTNSYILLRISNNSKDLSSKYKELHQP